MDTIDFVIPWVDGEDSQWKAEKTRYEKAWFSKGVALDETVSVDDANADCRYRELGFLRFWFRSVEQFAPWVNRVYFVTCGQRPNWLNVNHPKLVLVNHRDFIPEKYLPTFCSNVIELNLHRIAGLSEHFVYFNDDIFLLRPVKPGFFFKDGDPLLLSSLRYPKYLGINNWSHHAFNDYCLVNRCHNMGKSIWENRRKWFDIKELGLREAFRNFICYLANKSLPVGNYGHVALPNLKSTIADIWGKCYDSLDHACSFKFRSDDQLNQWVFCAWNQALGKFYPSRLEEKGRRILISPENMEWICSVIEGQLLPQVCLNDTEKNTDPNLCSERIVSSLNKVFPLKSSFELD